MRNAHESKPASFTEVRLRDAQAIVCLDCQWAVIRAYLDDQFPDKERHQAKGHHVTYLGLNENERKT